MARKKQSRILAAGPKACLNALRSLASVGVASGDTYSILRSPSLWPHRVHEDIKDACKPKDTTVTPGCRGWPHMLTKPK